MASPRITTVLFDIDGTLVDSNYLHVDAWDRALVAVGHPVDVWRIHRGIGMDAGRMLSELVGDDDALQQRAKDEHARLYADMADRLRPISGARDLLRELSRRGLTVVLATSAPQEELDALLAVLDLDEPVDAVTSAEDVDDAKPAPDVVGRALEKAGAAASEAIMVGDAVWDIESAGRAGVTAVAVLTGGSSADQLRDAGAVAVYDDVASLLAQLDASPLVANAD
ncbi:MAG: HAD family hydrolase [Microbacterium sp.]|nr:HAD family hydrolase [Microbacterium sp.]